ncbi:hypothetical protein BRADI_1g10845v3 [Brachypodium distachyon]|uniref:Aminotransferase-like plant mobile domain-containing protein n=1 Tax=Brachypodium distachyon TaxID=15368 RepID=A0A0Q3GT41_BRADI|nr:hypothetical protein BRADI_1g10845v3 [Brachypodium distachyon]
MSDIDVGCDDDGLSSDSNSEFSDFVPSNWVGAANVGGPAAADAVSDSLQMRQKSHQADQLDDHKKASNRGNLAWLSHIINSIHSDKRHIIGDYGFPFVFHINSSSAPRSFSQWIADHIQPDSGDIVVESGVIHLGAHGFSEVIGLENSALEVKGDFEGSKEQFLSLMGFSELPTIKQFGKLLLTNDLPNEKYFICFMVVFLSRFLCPNSSTYPSTKYLGSLLVPSDVRNFNWASFSHNWFMESVRKYQKDKRKSKALSSKSNLTLGGCTYVPAVKYLDFADFG